MSRGGCFNCGAFGHRSRHCPEPRKPRDRSGDQCRKCGEVGHWAKDCTNARRRRCGECRAFGHTKTTCPVVKEREAHKAAEAERRAQEAAERARALWTQTDGLRKICGKHAFIKDAPHRSHCDGQVWVGGNGGQSMPCGHCSAKRALVEHARFVLHFDEGGSPHDFKPDVRTTGHTPEDIVALLPFIEGKGAAEAWSAEDGALVACALKHMSAEAVEALFSEAFITPVWLRPRGAAKDFGPADIARSLRACDGDAHISAALITDDYGPMTLRMTQKSGSDGGGFLIHLRTDTDAADWLFAHIESVEAGGCTVHRWGKPEVIGEHTIQRCDWCGLDRTHAAAGKPCNAWRHADITLSQPVVGNVTAFVMAHTCGACEKPVDWSRCEVKA